MHHPDLIAYIQAHLEHETRPEEIVRELEEAGWSRQDIDRAFGQIRNTAQPTHTAHSSQSIEEQLEAIQALLKTQSTRLDALESKAHQPLHAPLHSEMVRDMPAPTPQESELEQTIVRAPEAGHESMESKITGKWFAVVGIVALLFGVSFFLKYAFDNDWIGVTGRVILGFFVGLGFLVAGEVLRQKPPYKQYSLYISGGGLAMLYLTIFAGTYFYQIINPLISIALMFVVNIAGVILGLRSNSESLAAIAIFGGFLTPFLFGFGLIDHTFTFTYALLLDLVVVAISFFQKWRKLYLLSFIGTYMIFFGWYTSYTPAVLGSTMVWLTLFYALFLAAPLLPSFMRREQSDNNDLFVIAVNSLCYFPTVYFLLNPLYHPLIGFFFAGWAAIALAIALGLRSTHSEDRFGIMMVGGVGLVLATIAIPVQLTGHWITMAWAVEGVVLTWMGMQLSDRSVRTFGLLVLGITGLRLIAFETELSEPLETITPILNARFMIFVVTAVSYFAAVWMYQREKQKLESGEENIAGAFAVLGNIITLSALSMDVSLYFDRSMAVIRAASTPHDVFETDGFVRPQDSVLARLRNLQNLSLSILWAAYASMLMVVGMMKHLRLARILSLVLFAIVIGKVFLVDSSELSELYRILSFITLGTILLGISFLFYRYKEKIKEFILAQ